MVLLRKVCFVLSVGVSGVMLTGVVFATLIYMFFHTTYLDGVVDFVDTLAKEFHNGR